MRQDILTGEWVIFAGNRMKRPYDFIKKSVPKTSDSSDCQFCPGNEKLTTSPVYQDGADGEWSIRVFPNKYPAVSREYEEADGEGFYKAEAGRGIHEVVVDTPDHNGIIHDFSEEKLFGIFEVIRDRYTEIASAEGIKYVQIFKNCGPDAGASIMHSHWQIIGVPVIPREQAEVLLRNRKRGESDGGCIICAILGHELERGVRIIAENECFAAFSPYASKMSYETAIVSKRHIATFGEFGDDTLRALAEILKKVLSAVKTLRKGICYNLCFEDTPRGEDGHWYMRVLPRMGNPAGFEYGTNSYINPIFPEDAAEYMREKISENYRGK